MLPILLTLAGQLLLARAAPPSTYCPLLGPVFPPPSGDALSAAVQSAQATFFQYLDDAFSSGILDAANTSFSVGVFSAETNCTLFEYHYAAPGLNGSLTSGVLDKNTIYRIGSISKLFTVYNFLINDGFKNFNEPITKFVPELAAAANPPEGDVAQVKWSDITVEAIAAQLADIGRDWVFGNLATLPNLDPAALGLPVLNESEIPRCGSLYDPSLCTREEFFEGLLARHPVYSAFTTPVYSNIAFQILAYALESITGTRFNETLINSVIKPLNMSRTFLLDPPASVGNFIIPPGDETTVYWHQSLGDEDPAGGYYSSTADFQKLGLSILHNTLLPPATTRKWMKPTSHTSSLRTSVGAPWEIIRMEMKEGPGAQAQNRTVDLYSKAGDIGLYSSVLVVEADHNTGFSVLAAGRQPGPSKIQVADLVARAFIPAFEQAAREEATANFAGQYGSSVSGGNSSSYIVLASDDNYPGLYVTNWTSNGVDVLHVSLPALYQIGPDELGIRLYPTDLRSGNRLSFRIVSQYTMPPAADGTVISEACFTWASVDGAVYGRSSLDELIFTVDGEGVATTIELVGLKQVLKKTT